jgi:hypothetical protein
MEDWYISPETYSDLMAIIANVGYGNEAQANADILAKYNLRAGVTYNIKVMYWNHDRLWMA